MIRFCWGEDFKCCADCRWNIDNIDPERILPDGKPFKPAANPPKCHDWAAVPHKAGREL